MPVGLDFKTRAAPDDYSLQFYGPRIKRPLCSAASARCCYCSTARRGLFHRGEKKKKEKKKISVISRYGIKARLHALNFIGARELLNARAFAMKIITYFLPDAIIFPPPELLRRVARRNEISLLLACGNLWILPSLFA